MEKLNKDKAIFKKTVKNLRNKNLSKLEKLLKFSTTRPREIKTESQKDKNNMFFSSVELEDKI